MRNAKRFLVAVAVLGSVVDAVGQLSKLDFEKDDVGKPPKGSLLR